MDMNKSSWKIWQERLIPIRNNIGFCPLCNANIKDRTVALFKELVDSLYSVYCWCRKNQIHEFSMKEIRCFLDRNCYARWSDLCRFGGIVYKVDKTQYGINMERAKAFFNGTYKIPVEIVINQITGETISRKDVDITHFPKLRERLNNEGLYIKY